MTPNEMKRTILKINENWKQIIALEGEIRKESIPLLLDLAKILGVAKNEKRKP